MWTLRVLYNAEAGERPLRADTPTGSRHLLYSIMANTRKSRRSVRTMRADQDLTLRPVATFREFDPIKNTYDVG